jgi:regulator of replication initiation timing
MSDYKELSSRLYQCARDHMGTSSGDVYAASARFMEAQQAELASLREKCAGLEAVIAEVAENIGDSPKTIVEWSGRVGNALLTLDDILGERDSLRAENAGLRKDAGINPDWLWGKLMDYCKERRIHPATQNDLFSIVSQARAAIDAAIESQQEELSETHARVWELQERVAGEIASNAALGAELASLREKFTAEYAANQSALRHIERLEAEVSAEIKVRDDVMDERDKLRAENAKLRKALESAILAELDEPQTVTGESK